MTPPLYNRELLALAVALAEYPRFGSPARSGERRAPLCGSRVLLDLDTDTRGRVTRIGIAAEACALGQAAATLLARGAMGRNAAEFADAATMLAAWLSGTSDTPPDWPGVSMLAPARAYPARHAAILLPFQLAAELTATVTQGQAA